MNIFLLLFGLISVPAFAGGKAGCDLKKAGFHHPGDFEKFFTALQAAAAAKDAGAISKMANYPLRIGDEKRIQNETELKEKFDSVFTPKVLAAITSQKRSTLDCDYQGAKIGGGTVWIQEVEGVVVVSALHEKP
jgi:hypothetical protein